MHNINHEFRRHTIHPKSQKHGSERVELLDSV